MNDILEVIKKNPEIYHMLNNSISLFHDGKEKEALEKTKELFCKINNFVIKDKLNLQLAKSDYNSIRKSYKEKDQELYEYYTTIMFEYGEIKEEGKITNEAYMYIIELMISFIEVIINKYGNIEIK